jgi:hypothetical protein
MDNLAKRQLREETRLNSRLAWSGIPLREGAFTADWADLGRI